MPEQLTMFPDDDANYQAFVDKFKPKKTTDDCYTPANIYEAVAAWVAEEYHRDRAIVAGLSGGEEVHSPHDANPDPFDLENLMNLPKEAT